LVTLLLGSGYATFQLGELHQQQVGWPLLPESLLGEGELDEPSSSTVVLTWLSQTLSKKQLVCILWAFWGLGIKKNGSLLIVGDLENL
jgi:hypothetical protein